MKLSTFFNNMKKSEALIEGLTNKLEKLSNTFRYEISPQATFRKQPRDQYKVEVTIPLQGGAHLRAESTAGDAEIAMDQVVQKLERQSQKYKSRYEKRHQKSALRTEDPSLAMEEERLAKEESLEPLELSEKETFSDSEEPMIVRTKQLTLKPMAEEEAILQMEMLDHDFFLYQNPHGKTCLLYKRKDGNLGLIETDF